MTSSPTVSQVNNYPDLAAIQQTIRRSAPKEQLELWMKPKPAIVYRDLALDWLGILVALIVVAQVQTWWMYAIAFLVVGFFQYALFILGHDALHSSLHPNRKVNDLISKWFIHGPMFMGLEDGRRNHLEHHRNLGTDLDPDRYLHTLANKNSRSQVLLFCTGLATFGKTVLKVTPFGRLLNQSKVAKTDSIKSKPSGALSSYFIQRIPVFVVQPLLIGLFLLLGLPWWAYLLLWFAPIYFCVFLPDEVRAFCDHAILTYPDYAADSQRLVTVTPYWIEAMIFSPHNMNYHAEHHLWAAIPYYNLPKVHQFVRQRPEVTVRKSYIQFLLKVLSNLPLRNGKETAKG